MKFEQRKWTAATGWITQNSTLAGNIPQIVLCFGERDILSNPERYSELRKIYPESHLALSSTSGNIQSSFLDDHSVTTTAIFLERSHIIVHKNNIKNAINSYQAGVHLGEKLNQDGLKHVFILSDGHLVNGSELVKGLVAQLPSSVSITGGLAGDGTRFEKTIVGLDAPPKEGEILAIGFFGDNLKIGMGSVGGWDPFGIERKITRSVGNKLYELDGKVALELYKNYLGEQSNDLPGSALLFPLAIRPDLTSKHFVVRTILSINEEDNSMIFAGDIPEGWYAQLMKANFDRLIDGAAQAAYGSFEMLGNMKPECAILISCVGRRMVLDQKVEEEIEVVNEIIGKDVVISGFYSYGEIAPMYAFGKSELHNQTMTITALREL